jgi:RimJ/RimL family protein N-acetyltransferase
MTLAWRNQDHIRIWFVHADPLTWEQHKNWCTQYFQRDNDFIFIIEEIRDLHKPVGQISLYSIEWDRGRAEYGRLLIGESEAVGKGMAKEATNVLLEYAFSQFGLTEITLEVFSTNVAAIAIYQACGFREVSESDGLKRMVKVSG